jgi:hypothetical protein
MWKTVNVRQADAGASRVLVRVLPLRTPEKTSLQFECAGFCMTGPDYYARKRTVERMTTGHVQAWTLIVVKKKMVADQLTVELTEHGCTTLPIMKASYVDLRRGTVEVEVRRNRYDGVSVGSILALDEPELSALVSSMHANIWYVSNYELNMSPTAEIGRLKMRGRFVMMPLSLKEVRANCATNFALH